jgi:hypothetical protein
MFRLDENSVWWSSLRCERLFDPGRLFGPEWLLLNDLVIQRQVDVHPVFLDLAV